MSCWFFLFFIVVSFRSQKIVYINDCFQVASFFLAIFRTHFPWKAPSFSRKLYYTAWEYLPWHWRTLCCANALSGEQRLNVINYTYSAWFTWHNIHGGAHQTKLLPLCYEVFLISRAFLRLHLDDVITFDGWMGSVGSLLIEMISYLIRENKTFAFGSSLIPQQIEALSEN